MSRRQQRSRWACAKKAHDQIQKVDKIARRFPRLASCRGGPDPRLTGSAFSVPSPWPPSSSVQQMVRRCCDRHQHHVPAALFSRPSSQPVMKTGAMLIISHRRPPPHTRLQLSRLRHVASCCPRPMQNNEHDGVVVISHNHDMCNRERRSKCDHENSTVWTKETHAHTHTHTLGFVFNAFSALCDANALIAFFSSFAATPRIVLRSAPSVRTLLIASGSLSMFLRSRAKGCASGIHSPDPRCK